MKQFRWMQRVLFLFLLVVCSVGMGKNRKLLVISELDHRGVKELRPLYEKIESLAWRLPSRSSSIRKIYQKMELLRDASATSTGAQEFIVKSVVDAEVDQVDIIIGVHGLPGQFAFYDGAVKVDDWASSLRESIIEKAGQSGLSKLGLFYNLSCFGASHIQALREVGFKAVIGSRKVNANAEIEYPWVLEKLAMGRSIGQALRRPNSTRWLMVADEPVRWVGKQQNNFLQETDSYKEIGGDLNYRIY